MRRLYSPWHKLCSLSSSRRRNRRCAVVTGVQTCAFPIFRVVLCKYLPSYLILAQYNSDAFHVLFAIDVEGDNVRIVTSYRPSTEIGRASSRERVCQYV